jgi:hypothetical protein
MNPPRWSEMLLRRLLRDRDRDTISGDLLEEYREVAAPAHGDSRARWWYRRQVAGFVWRALWAPALIGCAFGAVLGVMTLVDTAREPLADDAATTMLAWVGVVVLLWSAATVAVTWRTRRMSDAITVGAILGVMALAVFQLAAIVRVNVFLDTIQHRDDWRNLVARYNQSGFHSLRAYANYEYAVMVTPILLAIGAIAGSICGMIGAIVHKMRQGLAG